MCCLVVLPCREEDPAAVQVNPACGLDRPCNVQAALTSMHHLSTNGHVHVHTMCHGILQLYHINAASAR
jgi:hypothetical protein